MGKLNQDATSTQRLRLIRPATSFRGAAAATLEVDEVHHPLTLFVDPSYAELGLLDIERSYVNWLRGRGRPVKPPTLRKYRYSLDALFKHMRQAETPLELQYLHPAAVNAWIADCRTKGQSEDGISSTLAALKAFSNGFITKHAELCIADPLRKVARVVPPDKEMPVLEKREIEAVLNVYGEVTFEDVRNKAFLGVLLSTGARLREARELALAQWDGATSELTFNGKGDRFRYATLGDRPAGYLKAYLRLRPKHTSGMLWLQRDGSPISEGGWQMVFRRLKRKSGVPRVHAHLLRHTFGSHAINAGAERAAVQDMMGHLTDQMTARYTRDARKRTASVMMPGVSPI